MASAAASAAPAVPPSLSLPPSQFARLQPHAYLLAHLSPPPASNQPSIRANGRAPSQFRVTSANAGSLTHTNGSAVVRIGDTTAVCGVRAEILHTDDIASWSVSQASATNAKKRRRLVDLGEKPTTDDDSTRDTDAEEEEDRAHLQDLNLLVPNLSLSTGCAPGFIPGAPPSALAQSLSHQILSLLHSTRLVRTDDLRIWYQPPSFGPEDLERHNEDEQMDVDVGQGASVAEGKTREIKAFWVLYIDVMIISLAGNPFDAAWASVLAALRDTKLPKAWWDVDNETILCSDSISESRKLSLRGFPVASSFCVFEADAAAGWRAVVIPDADEQKAADQKKKGAQQKWILADPDGYEEGLSQERACVVVDKEKNGNGKTVVAKMEKHGGWTVDTEDLRRLVDISAQRWDEMKRILDQC
ncbi:exoribonuclease family protein [Penicillium hispanicum]|uniref:exoribonuclease family protein n=1 Tax=Penicillium hispanicum TaxID=1080232 RepID=UPI0025425DCE|nr:exoribonuclease family protein [Penicillium hispanicum]KAJ5595565.1 exoribonuclease family protein [Penicillium hispanicum]